MSRRTSTSAPAPRAGRPLARPSERDLLAQLGLPESAGPSAIDAAHADIVAFLESAPMDLRGWAKQAVATADEAYALLSDPGALSNAEVEIQNVSAPKASVKVTHVATAPPTGRRGIGRTGRLLIAAGALIGTLAAAYFVYASDVPSVPGLTGTPAPEVAAQPTLNTGRVAELMQAIQADANDVEALQELADLYFNSGDYAVAGDWENKILAIDPDNVTAHLAIGAALYNTGNSTDAETHWRRVLELEPQNVEAHYDLGFMYFSSDPPDLDRTVEEWQQVLDIAPDSEIAQTVAPHLETIEQWRASSSPTSSSSPVSTATPSATDR
jgi:tetratricopeptide (TPR) repeat protein